MTRFAHRASAAAAMAAVATLAFTGSAWAQDYEWPRLLVVGTGGTSTGSFASTNGWAPVLQKEEGVVVRVVPEDNEPMRYRRLVERRDIAVTSLAASEMRSQTEGIGGYAITEPAAQRLVWHHNDTPWGFVVAGGSDLQTLADIKKGGVRVTEGMFSPTTALTTRLALPAFLGLTPEEAAEKITLVPASSYGESCRSVVEGKSDVAYCSPISSVLSEMEGAPGSIRWLSMPREDKEAWARYLQHRPMLVPGTFELGVKTAQGIDGATSNHFYVVPADADEAFAYNLAKWMHQSFDAYKGTHPLAARMSVELFRGYLDRSPLPVHEGTIRYLREIGQWTDADDVWNQEAIEKMDAWVAARKAAMAEAQETGVQPDFQDPAYLAILEKHTVGLESFRSRL